MGKMYEKGEEHWGGREERWGEREALKECWEGRRVLGRERSVGIREEHWEGREERWGERGASRAGVEE